jgi:hypothetical protein
LLRVGLLGHPQKTKLTPRTDACFAATVTNAAAEGGLSLGIRAEQPATGNNKSAIKQEHSLARFIARSINDALTPGQRLGATVDIHEK